MGAINRLNIDEEFLDFFDSDGDILILRAPAGFGKTKAALFYLYKFALKGGRVAIFFRTIEEIDYALRLLKEIKNVLGGDVKVFPIIGKDKMCRFKTNRKDLLKWWCLITECEYLKRRKSGDLSELLRKNVFGSVEDYYVFAREGGLCPYYFYVEGVEDGSIVLATHKYFLDERLFEKLGELDLAIIDEAHNIFIIKLGEIDKRAKALGEKIYLFYKDSGLRDDMFAKKLWLDGEIGGIESLAKYLDYLEVSGVEIDLGDKLVKVLTPKQIYARRLEKVKKIILMSSTIYPINLYREVIKSEEFKFVEKIRHGLLDSGDLRRIYGLVVGLTMSYKRRSLEMYEKYVSVINYISKKLREPIIVFAPNIEIAKFFSNRLDGVFLDRRSEILNECGELVFVTYARSPISEGVELDLGKCNVRVLIIAGLPFPKIDLESRTILRYYSKFLGLDYSGLVEAYRISEMLSTLIQIIGRVGRRERGVAVIVDDRIKKYPLNINYFNNLNILVRKILEFLKV